MIALVILVGMCAGGAASASTGAEDDPTAVVLREVRATAIPGERSIEVFWATGSEADVAGFNVMRGTSDAGPWEQANENAIIAVGDDMTGAEYTFVDADVSLGITYYYCIQEIMDSGDMYKYLDWVRSATLYVCYLPLSLG